MFLTAITFFIVLSILVLIHELGHFMAAKKFGIKVEEFGFGLPPRVWGKKVGETIYSLNWLPFGGFVRLFGEDRESDTDAKISKSELNRAFFTRPLWQRAIVLTAGVTMNFLFAAVVLSYLFTQGVFVPAKRVHIEDITPNSPAQQAGIQKNDIVISVDSRPVVTSDELISYTKERLGEAISVSILRGANFDHPVVEGNCDGCQSLTLTLTPRKDAPQGEGPLGISISNYEKRAYTWYQAPVQGLKESVFLSWELLKGLGQTIFKAITLQNVSKDVAGPIGIAQVTGQARQYGFTAVLELMGLLSLNLAILNILPFPALDGGRLFFVILEAIFGKRIKTSWERNVHQIGMIILLTLIFLITLNDILKLFGKI